MTNDELDVLQIRLDTLQTQLDRLAKLFGGVAQTVDDALDTLVEIRENLPDANEEEEETPDASPALYKATDLEWVQIADVLPPEGEQVLARWCDSVVNWTYYKKSVEYPGAFCFYDQHGQAVTAPKEWLSPRTAPAPEQQG